MSWSSNQVRLREGEFEVWCRSLAEWMGDGNARTCKLVVHAMSLTLCGGSKCRASSQHSGGLIRIEPNNLAQAKLFKEREVELSGLTATVQVVLDHPKVLRRDERPHRSSPGTAVGLLEVDDGSRRTVT